MHRSQRGDVAAFGALYDHLAPLVYGICLRVTSDPTIALEASQEAFLTMWQLAPGVDFGHETIEVWTSSIAHRRADECLRSNQGTQRQTAVSQSELDLGDVCFRPYRSAPTGVFKRILAALLGLAPHSFTRHLVCYPIPTIIAPKPPIARTGTAADATFT